MKLQLRDLFPFPITFTWRCYAMFSRETQKGFIYTTILNTIGEGNVTHSSILAWKIPWIEEPGGLQSMGSQSQTRLSD